MSYPIEKSLILQHTAAVCRRFRLLILLGGLLCGCFAGFAVFKLMPAIYNLHGIILLAHVEKKTSETPGKNTAETLERLIHRDFIRFALTNNYSAEDISFKTSAKKVDDSVVLNWSVDCANIQVAERFLQYQAKLVNGVKQSFPGIESGFAADNTPQKLQDFRKSMIFSAVGVIAGVLFGVLAGIIIGVFLLGCDHAIGHLGEFEKKYALSILGVLPQVGSRRNIDMEKLAEEAHFRQAVNSLLLNVLLFKRSAGRALVLAVSSLKARNGSGSTAWHLAQMLKKYDFRVLLLGKDDLNTDSLPLAGSIENLLAREAGNWDFIIIDTPDSRNSSIPLIVGRLADFMLLVCDYRNSPGYLLSVVLWRFRKAQVKIAGCVINHFPIRKRYADFDAYQHSFYRYNPQ